MAFVSVALAGFSLDRTAAIRAGMSSLSKPMVFTSADDLVNTEDVTITIQNPQQYYQHVTFTTLVTNETGTTSVTITAAGKVNWSDASWTTIGTPAAITGTETSTITSTTPNNYNWFKITYASTGTHRSVITSLEVRTANCLTVPANSGTLTIGRATSGPVVVQVKDNDVNADATFRAGGTGALTLGATTGSTTILSSGTIASTSNLTNFVAYSTDVDGRSIYGKATVSSGFNTTGPVIGAGVFGRVNGASPTLTAGTAYLGGTFGYYGITGTVTNTHPKAGLIGVIGDVTTTADAAVLALLDGDTGITTATAAYGVRQTNSTGASGFTYGLDLYGAAISGYLAVAYKTADIRFSKQEVISNATDGSLTMPNVIIKHTGAVAVNADATVSAATMLAGVITSTSGAATAITTPTATAIAALIPGCGRGTTFDLIIDNSAGSNTVTLVLDGSISVNTPAITGGATLTVSTANTVGLFRFYFVSGTAAKVFRVY